MARKQNAPANSDLEITARSHLQQLLLRICFFRLCILILLLLPLGLAWLDQGQQSQYLGLFLEPTYTIFLVTGFALTLFFLLSWSLFQSSLFFFRLQMLADFCLTCFLILLTGGLQSHFSFLLLALIFLYGRILGIQTAKWLTLCCSLFLVGIFAWDMYLYVLPPGTDLDPAQQVYFISLQILALALVLLLLNMGYGRENRLLFKLAKQEQLLHRSEVIKSKVLDWMTSGLLVLDQQGLISSINRRAAEWAAGKPDPRACIGRPLSELFPDISLVWSKWDQDTNLRKEVKIHSENKVFGATFTPIAQERSSLIIFSDITRFKELEQQVQQMEKLASIGELATGLAHEIKNPLAGIKGSLQLITLNSLRPEHKKKLRRVIERDIQRLDHLLSDFLVFARPSQAKPQNLNLGQRVQACLANLEHRYPELEVRLDPILHKTFWNWDQDQLQQVLLNLLLNAVQAGLENNESRLEISLGQDAKGQYLTIQDNGPGLPALKHGQIFDPFVTSKKDGSGLGLSIAQRLAAQNNSWIEIKDNKPHGAQARIYLAKIPTKPVEA